MRPIYLLERHRRSIGEATTDFLPVDPDKTSPAPRCGACGQPVGMRSWEPPFRVEIETWGSRFGDLAFGPGDEFLVSERFASLWKHERLVGLHGFEPVEIAKVRYRGERIKEAPPHYVCRGLSLHFHSTATVTARDVGMSGQSARGNGRRDPESSLHGSPG